METSEDINLAPRARQAMEDYNKAVEAYSRENPNPSDDQVYDRVVEAYIEKEELDDLPTRATWKRYLGLARQATNQQKNKPRSNARAKTTRSVVLQSEL